jgi:riboflavin kinase / FMN adenylyltransferase
VRVVEGVAELRPAERRVVAIGTFDGVHLGHRALIETARDRGAQTGAVSTVLTFEPMPVEVLRPGNAPPRLSGISRRAALVGDLGPDELLIVRFDRSLAALTPEQFAERILAGALRAVHVVVGQDYRFGNRAAGDTARLIELGREHGFTVSSVPLVRIDGERVSSSWIRELIEQGEVAHAARLLGRDPWLEGVVVHGEGRGKALGVPTANLAWPPGRVVPGRGIYAGSVVLAGGARQPAAISVGGNPTFGGDNPTTVEAHLIDWDGDLYDQIMRIEFREFLRHELRFEGIDDLIAQMKMDIDRARQIVSGGPPSA